MTIEPDTVGVQVASADKLFFLSRDSGSNWQTSGEFAQAIAVDPFAANHIIRTGGGSGVLESRDSGQTWAKLEGLPDQVTFTRVFFHPSKEGIVFVSRPSLSPPQMWRSSDGGHTCQQLQDVTPLDGLTGSDRSLVGWAVQSVFLSGDDGLTWTRIPAQLPALSSVVVDPIDAARVLAGTTTLSSLDAGIWESIDGGRAFRTEAECRSFHCHSIGSSETLFTASVLQQRGCLRARGQLRGRRYS